MPEASHGDVTTAADLQGLEAVGEIAEIGERRVLQVAAVVEPDLTH